jgi:ankyrin repeat protein
MPISNKELQERNRNTEILVLREVEKSSKFGDFAIGEAFVFGSMYSLQEELERMLDSGVDVNIQRQDGCTALMVANNIKIVNFLLSKGADPNLVNNRGENALVCYLSGFQREGIAYRIVKTLLEAGSDPSIIAHNEYDDYYTALDRAKEKYSNKICGLIEDYLKKKSEVKI